MVRQIRENDKCECENCKELAIDLVYSRNREEVLKCCLVHSDIIVDERSPEYTEYCANCGCNLPIN
jgi:hypothetical protein